MAAPASGFERYAASLALGVCQGCIAMVSNRNRSRGGQNTFTRTTERCCSGLSHLQTSHLLVLAVDLPQMTTEHLRKLWGLASPGMGVIPANGGYFEPLCAIYPVEAVTAVEAALNSSDVSLQSFAQTLRLRAQAHACDLTPEEKPLYLNLNTPVDLLPKSGPGG